MDERKNIDRTFEDFLVDKDDTIQDNKKEDVELTKEQKDMIAHNQKVQDEALSEYETSITEYENTEMMSEDISNYNENGKSDDSIIMYTKIEKYNKWDAMHLLDLMNIYHDFFEEKDAFLNTVYDTEDISGSQNRENTKLNQVILDIDVNGYYETEMTDEQLIGFYSDLKGIHQQVLNLTKVEEINQGLVSMNQYNAYKSNYEAV